MSVCEKRVVTFLLPFLLQEEVEEEDDVKISPMASHFV